MEKPRDLAHLIEAFVGWVSDATLETPPLWPTCSRVRSGKGRARA